jgi:hypothetical protein
MEVHGQSLLQEGQAADIHNLVKLQRLIEQIGELHVRFPSPSRVILLGNFESL